MSETLSDSEVLALKKLISKYHYWFKDETLFWNVRNALVCMAENHKARRHFMEKENFLVEAYRQMLKDSQDKLEKLRAHYTRLKFRHVRTLSCNQKLEAARRAGESQNQ